MAQTEELLERAAADGTWENEEWPQVLEEILSRLDKIIRTEFPLPRIAPQPSPPVAIESPTGEPSSQESTTSNKENAPTTSKAPAVRPPVPSFPSSIPEPNEEPYPTDFPPDLVALHRSIRKSLKTDFPRYPPHTIQRLSELVLRPKRHYRYLPSYLNALNRVVSVQSTTTQFPLPQATLPSSGSFLNGASSAPATTRPTPELGSDESLGGALLTPIPWLANRSDSQRSTGSSSSSEKEPSLQTSSTEMVEGPNGAGRIETVNVINGVMTPVSSSAAAGLNNGNAGREGQTTEESLRAEGAVTQGELLRQEQQAGVVAVQPRGLRLSDQEMSDLATSGEGSSTDASDEEKPHARGPDEIGDEDIGPQDRPVGAHLDLEAAVGRSRRDSSVDPEDASLSDAGGGREEDMPDVGSAIADDEDEGLEAAVQKDESRAAGDGADEGTESAKKTKVA